MDPVRVTDQKAVDDKLLSKIEGLLKDYLSSRFSLSKSQRPHEMVF